MQTDHPAPEAGDATGRTDGTDAAGLPARYDFGRPAALSREHTRALDGAFDAFARQWAMQLTAKARLRTHIAVERVTLETYDEYVGSVPTTTTLVLCADPDSDDRAIVEFPLPTTLSWIVTLLGGDASHRPDARSLTTIEQALLRSMMDETLSHLKASLGDLVPPALAVSAVQYTAAFAQIAAPQDLVVVARFSMRSAERSDTATIAFPAAALLERLSRTAATPRAVADPDVVRRHVEETPVDVTLRLASRRVSPDDVLDLAVGDVLTLPHGESRPLDLTIGGDVVAAAAIGASGARLACVVTSADLAHSLVEETP